MMTKRSAIIFLCALVVILLAASACSRGRTDAQIASDIQSKIGADLRLANKQVNVQVKDGAATLSGRVDSDAEKNLVQSYAAGVDGVKSVANNIEVGAPPAQMATEPPPAPPEEPKPAKRAAPAHKAAPAPAPGPAAGAATPAAAPAAAAAPAPGPPPEERVTIPTGTELSIRMIDSVDSDKNKPGDTFKGTLETPIMIEEKVAVPKGTDVEGKVVELESAGRFQGRSQLTLVLTKVSFAGKTYQVQTDPYLRQGSSRGKKTAAMVGGGGALGAIIGGIAGGGKGAAIGAASGVGAGAGVQAVTKGQQIRVPSESIVDFRLKAPLTVTPAATAGRRAR